MIYALPTSCSVLLMENEETLVKIFGHVVAKHVILQYCKIKIHEHF